MMTAEAVKVYAFNVNDDGTLGTSYSMNARNVTEDNPGKEVDQHVKRYMVQHGEKDYGRALYMVLDAEPSLKARYAGVS